MADVHLGPEQKYSLITRRLEVQNGWSAQKLHSLLTNGRTVKYQWGQWLTSRSAFMLINSSRRLVASYI